MADTMGTAPGFIDHPDHNVDLSDCTRRQRAIFGGRVIADSADALIMQEASYPQVVYFPRGDVCMDLLERTDNSSYCPFKGNASYWSIPGEDEAGRNIAWSYEAPYEEMAALKDYIAFYADRVKIGPQSKPAA